MRSRSPCAERNACGPGQPAFVKKVETMPIIESTPEFVAGIYAQMRERLEVVRRRLGRPLTLAEKIVYGHLDDAAGENLTPGEGYLQLRPDRVALQDVTGQMALLQFMLAARDEVAVPTTVHCDHLIRAQNGSASDLKVAHAENSEVFDFLASASRKYGIGFWNPGAGIIHQVVLENYAFPGGLMIGTDSHTPNAGGLGMLAVGVGGADAVDAMVGFPWEVKSPNILGVRLTGQLGGWTAPKDVILKLLGILTTSGGTNRVIEYFGPGTGSLSCTGRATITNMGAELGATSSIFPYDRRMATYLRATDRGDLASLADHAVDLVTADEETDREPAQFYEDVIEIDLTDLEPHVVGPHRPDLARPISELAADVEVNGYPDKLSAALIGSCTNSSYEDVSRAANIAAQAAAHGVTAASPLLVTPGSEAVRATIERDGQLGILESIGATVLANACGPCIGQWRRQEVDAGENGNVKVNSIISSFNRNFPRRNDGNASTHSFLVSPEIAVAYGLAGRLSFNPLVDDIISPEGEGFRLEPPSVAPEVPADGFEGKGYGYVPPSGDGSSVVVEIDPESKRLEFLEPFPEQSPEHFQNMPVLLKATGQCTTDAISPAGPWLRFRGHLTNLSDNMFTGANNAFSENPGTGYNQITGADGEPIPEVAKRYNNDGLHWVAVGDENYGEGSSREHAAMSPRRLGGCAVIVRSFARIHESNLKKQGLLPLTFVVPADFDKIEKTDRIDLVNIGGLAPGAPVTAVLRHSNGSSHNIELSHTLNDQQIEWLWAGSALNVLRRNRA